MRKDNVLEMHVEIRHFGEQRTLVEIYKRYYWHNRTAEVRAIVKACKECQLVRQIRNIMSHVENLENIPICDLFYKIALDTAGPLPETNEGNKYILIAIDHYFKCCKTKAIADHTIANATRFLKKYIIYRYGVPNFILNNNGGE